MEHFTAITVFFLRSQVEINNFAPILKLFHDLHAPKILHALQINKLVALVLFLSGKSRLAVINNVGQLRLKMNSPVSRTTLVYRCMDACMHGSVQKRDCLTAVFGLMMSLHPPLHDT